MELVKKKYQLADDGSYTPVGEPYEIVGFMRDSSRFAFAESIENFMEGFANRYQLDTGNRVRVDSCYNFVTDLVEIGYLREIKTDSNG